MYNLIFAMLHNTKTGRFHPILFYESPLPGNPENLVRHKSKGHHTEGFDSRDDALASIEGKRSEWNFRTCLEKDFTWDGEDTPAMVVFFAESQGKLEPVL